MPFAPVCSKNIKLLIKASLIKSRSFIRFIQKYLMINFYSIKVWYFAAAQTNAI